MKFSFEPKNEQKYFCISAPASKMGQIIKIMLIIMLISNHLSSNIITCIFFYLTQFRELGQQYKNIFIRFLVQIKTLKSASEINWPLARVRRDSSFASYILQRKVCGDIHKHVSLSKFINSEKATKIWENLPTFFELTV